MEAAFEIYDYVPNSPTGSPIYESKQQDRPGLIREEQKSLNPLLQEPSALHPDKSTCGLSRLPVEVLDIVLKDLNFEEVFNLGIQTQHFWDVACRHLQAYVASGFGGSWAGEGIICAGDYSEPKDLPLNVLTEVEKQVDFDPDSTNLYDLAYDYYEELERPHQLPGYRLLYKLQKWHHLTKSLKAQIFTELESYTMSNFYPADQAWILRNLTTQEYVRSEAIAVKPEHIDGPHISGRGFGDVLLSRICWSTKDSCGMGENTHNIHRGIWAGHHFDIRTLESHRQSSLGQTEWKDVSEEVANELEQIETEAWGSDWRDSLL